MISIFDLFSIGVGPSSSHTVGPMRAARSFVQEIDFKQLAHITVEVYGSLAFTGKGHGTDKAILMGLEGQLPDTVDPDFVTPRCTEIFDTKTININQQKIIPFNTNLHFIFNHETLLPYHSNGMCFKAFNIDGKIIKSEIYYSIGGGFILHESETQQEKNKQQHACPYPFENTHELLNQCKTNNLTIAELMLENESSLRSESEVKERLLHIYDTMCESIKKGMHTGGILPGGLNVKRRAADLYQLILKQGKPTTYHHTDGMNWLNLYAIAVNEENAAGGRVVTAPTNGAAGIIPAVLYYYQQFHPDANNDKIIEFLLTAGAITVLYKKNASISGAEVGCQGEVGVACSMAAGALTAVLGGTLDQVENAAEIGIEHHLGMTCDPIGGLVQIPCIERNAMGAVKAVNATRLALVGDGTHYVSLDKAILTMKKTGEDMHTIYKETSLGGLASNAIEC